MKKISIKNYIIFSIISIITIIVTLSFMFLFKDFNGKDNSSSLLSTYVKVVNVNELSNVLSDMNDAIIYFGVSNNNNSEKNVLNFLKRHNINDIFLYTNVENEDYNSIIKNIFLCDVKMQIPFIIYVVNGDIKEVINNESGKININKLQNLIDKYGLEESK